MLTDQGKNIRIIKLPPTDEIKPGYSVPVDDEVDGTKRFDLYNLTTAIERKADASEIDDLQEEIASKAGQEEIEELETKIEGKASQEDLDTLGDSVGQLDDAVSTAQGDITALQTAVDTKASSSDLSSLSRTVSSLQGEVNVISGNLNGLMNDVWHIVSDVEKMKDLLNSVAERWVLTPEQPTTVTIGGREYLTVKIGNQEWMAENLDYAYDGIVFRDGINGNTLSDNLSNYTQEASYYNYDENNSVRGLLYNWKAVNYLETNKSTLLPNGWRVPNRQDWSTLMDSIGYSWEGSPAHSLGGTVIRSIDWNGTDDFGFCAKGAGTFTKMAGFTGLDTKLNFWEIPESTETDAYSIRITKTDEAIYENTDSKIGAFSVRLVRDIT